MHNVLAITQKAVVSMVNKVQDNILYVVMAPVIALQPFAPSNSPANMLHTLLRGPNALVIKYMHLPFRKPKAAKLWPDLADT